MTDSFKTLCPYCGVGCGLEVMPPAQAGREAHRDSQGNPIWKVRGDRAHPSSQGMVCVKGATTTEPIAKDRRLYPMVRDSLDEPFRRVSWDDRGFELLIHPTNQGRVVLKKCLYPLLMQTNSFVVPPATLLPLVE